MPADNPFVGRGGARGEIYSYGLRNPWRFSFDRKTGDLSIGDVGQDEVEEIDFVRRGKGRGANFGWRVFEGRDALRAGRDGAGRGPAGDHSAATPTATARSPAASSSATRRCRRWRGRYVFGDFCRGVIQTARLSAGRARTRATDRKLKVDQLSSFGEDARGRVYASSLDGPVYRLVARWRPRRLDIALLRADNPGPLHAVRHEHLGRRARPGVGGRPRARRSTAHLDAVAAEVEARGGAGGIALTHDHADHAEGVPALRERLGARRWRPRAAADVRSPTATRSARSRALAVPGHADDHLVFVAGRAAFTGDAVLGEGSVFVGGRLREYLDGLRRLRALRARACICPGHGAGVSDPRREARRVPRAPRASASAGCWPRSRRAARARTSCSTPPGTTRPADAAPVRGGHAARAPGEAAARRAALALTA